MGHSLWAGTQPPISPLYRNLIGKDPETQRLSHLTDREQSLELECIYLHTLAGPTHLLFLSVD